MISGDFGQGKASVPVLPRIESPVMGRGAAMDSNALISAGAGLLGVVVGGVCTAYNQWRGRLSERYHDQLQNFYSPMLGMREAIKAKSELRRRLHEIAGATYPSIARTLTAEEIAQYDRIQEYSETQLRQDLIPTYQKMADLFAREMHLAEASTRAHYPGCWSSSRFGTGIWLKAFRPKSVGSLSTKKRICTPSTGTSKGISNACRISSPVVSE